MKKVLSSIVLGGMLLNSAVAAVYDTTGISIPKSEGMRFTAEDFNSTVGAIQGIFHDDNDTNSNLTDDRFKIGGEPDSNVMFEVDGKVGATEYCDGDGANCFTGADVTGGGSSLFDKDVINNLIELGEKSDGTGRSTGTEFVITDDGKVGIGKDSPDSELDIIGSVKIVDGNQGNGKVFDLRC